MTISIVFGQVWHIVRVETIHSAKWAFQALGTSVKLSIAQLFMPRTFSRSWDLSNASLRSRAHPLDCWLLCTCTSYWDLFLVSSSMSIFIYRCQKLRPSVPGSIFMLDNPSTVPKRVSGVWGVPASYFEGAFKLAFFAYQTSCSRMEPTTSFVILSLNS